MFRGIRPAVVALIAVPTFNMARSARISITNCWIPIVSALAIWTLGVSPIAVIIIAGTGGWIYGRYICRTKEKDGKHTGTDSPHTDGTHDKTARS